MRRLPALLGGLLGCASPAAVAPAPTSPDSQAALGVEAAGRAAGDGVVALRGGHHRIELGELALEVDARDGGRIVEFSLAGRSVVLPRSESPKAYGSSFWPSPQRDWNWPPPPELDALPWRASIEGAGAVLVLKSETNEALGISATQRMVALPDERAFRVDLELENRGREPRAVAAWQNTRTRAGGLTFFPSSAPSLPPSAFEVEAERGLVFFRHDPADRSRIGKLFADGDEGWVAHVDGDLLFVKVFPPVPRERQAPGEAEVEVYVDPEGTFVEVEQQGPYRTLEPGQSSRDHCYWLLERLAPGVEAAPGNDALLAQARGIAARVR